MSYYDNSPENLSGYLDYRKGDNEASADIELCDTPQKVYTLI